MTEATWEAYAEAGVERALALGNRGPVRLDDDGHLVDDIVDRGSYIGNASWNEATRAEFSREGDEYWRRDITL